MTDVIKRLQGRRRGGLNLAEVLVVVIILGILSTIAISAVRPMLDTSRSTVRRQDASILQAAEEAYLAAGDTNAYATVSQLVDGRLLRRPSQINSICLKAGPDGDYFVVKGIPATQAAGDAACLAQASRLSKTDPYLYLASAGTRAMP